MDNDGLPDDIPLYNILIFPGREKPVKILPIQPVIRTV